MYIEAPQIQSFLFVDLDTENQNYLTFLKYSLDLYQEVMNHQGKLAVEDSRLVFYSYVGRSYLQV